MLQHISPPPAGVTDILADKLWMGAGALHLHAEQGGEEQSQEPHGHHLLTSGEVSLVPLCRDPI